MSDYTELSRGSKSALSYYYITSGLEFILSVAVYVIFYFIWLRSEWPQYLVRILFVLRTLTVLELTIKPLWQYRCRLYQVDQFNAQYRTSFLIYRGETSRIERSQYLSIKSNPISRVLNLYKVGFIAADHTIYLPMMSHGDVKIIEARTMSSLRGVESDV